MTLRILGLDPGSLRTGWAVITADGPTHLHHEDNGVLVTDPDAPLPLKLVVLARGVAEVIRTFKPQVASVETAFHAKNARSALVLGQARGAILVSVAQAGVTVVEYGPMQVKLAVTGHGRAGKEGVQAMVAALMGLPEVPQQDAADALALAITHAQRLGRPAQPTTTHTRRERGGGRKAWEALLKSKGVV